jgi:hypothetical protein
MDSTSVCLFLQVQLADIGVAAWKVDRREMGTSKAILPPH